MKYRAILISVCVALPFGCSNSGGGSNTNWLSCTTDAQCGASQKCVNQHCSSVSTGGTGDGGHTSPQTGGSPDAGSSGGTSGVEAGTPDSAAIDGGGPESGLPRDGSFPDSSSSCFAGGAWSAAESVGGTGYSDKGLFGEPPRGVFIAGDGSAFTAWSAHDPTGLHVYAHASRYTPSGGWSPYLQFDEYEVNGSYGGSAPAVAVSENGEAMLLWRHATGIDGGFISYKVMAMRYASGWEAPVVIEGPETPTPMSYAIGADALGNFVAAWIDIKTGADGVARMVRYTRGSGWGAIESPPVTNTDAGIPLYAFGIRVSTASNGSALVTWAGEGGIYGPTSVEAERFDPSTGWSGKQTLAGPLFGQPVPAPSGAIGDDGSAAVAWGQAGPPFVARFSGTWSAPESLGVTTSGTGIVYSGPVIATDSRGTFIVAWSEQDAVYATKVTGSGPWSPRALLNVPAGTPDGTVATHEVMGPQIAMNLAGDAVLSWNEWDQNARTDGVDAVTYSPAGGWAASVRLDTDSRDVAPPLIDACGTATLTWIQAGTNDGLTARHAAGSTWTSPLPLGTVPSGYTRIADGLGSSGEIIASFRASDDQNLLAKVWK